MQQHALQAQVAIMAVAGVLRLSHDCNGWPCMLSTLLAAWTLQHNANSTLIPSSAQYK
jgi:hypothetical protein